MTHYGLEDLLDALDSSRERLLVAIEPLPDDAFLTPNAVGSWSIADVLANLTAWEAELVTGLLKINQNKRPDALLRALKDPKTYDAERYNENKERNLDQIFDDFQKVRMQVEEWLESFSEKALNNPQKYAYFQGKSLADMIAMTTFNHEQRLTAKVEIFASIWLAQEENQADEPPAIDGLIMLDELTIFPAETHGDTP